MGPWLPGLHTAPRRLLLVMPGSDGPRDTEASHGPSLSGRSAFKLGDVVVCPPLPHTQPPPHTPPPPPPHTTHQFLPHRLLQRLLAAACQQAGVQAQRPQHLHVGAHAHIVAKGMHVCVFGVCRGVHACMSAWPCVYACEYVAVCVRVCVCARVYAREDMAMCVCECMHVSRARWWTACAL